MGPINPKNTLRRPLVCYLLTNAKSYMSYMSYSSYSLVLLPVVRVCVSKIPPRTRDMRSFVCIRPLATLEPLNP